MSVLKIKINNNVVEIYNVLELIILCQITLMQPWVIEKENEIVLDFNVLHSFSLRKSLILNY